MTRLWVRVAILIAVTVAGAAGYWAGGRDSDSLAVIDLKRAIAIPAQLLAKSTLSASDQKKLLSKYTAHLQASIQNYARDHQLTIISSTVLYHGAHHDITNTIISKTLDEVRHV